MKKWIIFQTEEVKNYLIAKENSILLAEIFQDEDIDQLLEEKKLTKVRTIRYEDVKEFIFIDSDSSFKIVFKDDDVDEFELQLEESVFTEMKDHFISSMKGVAIKDYSLLKQIQPPGIAALVAAGITALLFSTAKSLERGEHVSTSGRRGLIKKLFVGIADFLGSTGSLLIGGLVVVFFVYLVIQIVRNPKQGKLIKIKDFVEMKF
ncbi:conserved hypothetical protein [Tenacibaculum sp. 190524A05c]|uniref:hypothetical protein n=1 Tax=Tenacibaculum platacis TaxID=3137852 RepID=UPI0031FAAC3B